MKVGNTNTMTMSAPLEVGLGVRDLKRMRHFYEKVMGCHFVSEIHVPAQKAQQAALSDEGYTVVRLQTPRGERIKLLASLTPPPAAQTTCHILERPNAAYLTFILDDIAAMIRRMLDEGVEFMTGSSAIEVRPGTWLAFCRDPEGHVLELVQYDDIAAYRPDLVERNR